jgi:regulator of replication initiation timing
MNQEFMTNLLQLYDNPLFAQSFLEFSARMQQAGVEAARQSWGTNRRPDTLVGIAPELFERMIDFYSSLGFVPKQQYDEVRKENDQLRKENEFLKNTLKELNLKVFTKGSLQVQEMWNETARKHMEMSAEMAKNFLDLFKPQSGE